MPERDPSPSKNVPSRTGEKTGAYVPASELGSDTPSPSFDAASTFDNSRTSPHIPDTSGWLEDDVPTAQPVLAGYQLEAELGRGGMGVVYRARDEKLGRSVALKLLLGSKDNPLAIARFLAESEAAAAIDHPHVIRVHQFGEVDGQPFLAMEYLPGGTLRHLLDQDQLRPRNAARLVAKIAEGVGAAHNLGIVHRDLKPGNVLFDAAEEPKVADFGLAKRGAGADLTNTGAILGTPRYMSPEQIRGAKYVGPPADVWSLGVILYECLTGRRPFESGELNAMLFAITQEAPTPPRKVSPAVPRDLELICLKCLEKSPVDRYQDANGLAGDLNLFLAGKPVSVRPAGMIERTVKWTKRNPVVASLLAAVALSLTVGATVGYANYLEARKQEAKAIKSATEANDKALLLGQQVEIANRMTTKAETNAKDAMDKELKWKQTATDLDLAGARLREEGKEKDRRLELAKLRDASAALHNQTGSVARDLLAEIAPEHRCIGWRLLNRQLESCLFSLKGHSGWVMAVALSADGSRIVTGSDDRTARVWNARTGELLLELKGHIHSVVCVAVSADGTRIATGSWDKTARLWDARTGKLLKTFAGHKESLLSLAMNADGSRIVTGAMDKTARVWNARTGLLHCELTGHSENVESVAMSADGSRIVTGCDDSVKVWDGNTGDLLLERKRLKELPLSAVAMSADGCTILSPSESGMRVWDSRTGHTLLELLENCRYAAMTPDGSTIVTSFGLNVTVRDVRSGRVLREYRHELMSSLAVSADGNRVAIGSLDCLARVYSVQDQPISTIEGDYNYYTSASWKPDSSLLVTAGKESAFVYDPRKGQIVLELTGHRDGITGVAWSPDGTRIATASKDHTARIWDARTGRTLFELTGHSKEVNTVSWSPDGNLVLTGSEDGTARGWNSKTGRQVFDIKGPSLDSGVRVTAWSYDGRFALASSNHVIINVPRPGAIALDFDAASSWIDCLAWSADGKWLVVGSHDKTVRVFNSTTGQLASRLEGHTEGVAGVFFTPDGQRIVSVVGKSVTSDTTVRVWDVSTAQPLIDLKVYSLFAAPSPDGRWLCTHPHTLLDLRPDQEFIDFKGHNDFVTVLALNADGQRLATGGGDATVRVWESQTGKQLVELKGHRHWISGVAWSADGNQIASASYDRTARIWDSRSGETLHELVGHNLQVTCVAWSGDGSRVATGAKDKTARVWDSRNGHILAELAHDEEVMSVALDRDGSHLAAALRGTTAQVWDVRTRQKVFELKGHEQFVERIAWSLDGGRIITWDGATVARVWDAATGQLLDNAPVPAFLNSTRSADGRFQFVKLGGARVRRLSLDIDEEEKVRRRLLTRPSPEFHEWKKKALLRADNDYGFALHRAFEEQALGVLAADAGKQDEARIHFQKAAELMPPTPRFRALAPPPREKYGVIPSAD